MDSDVKRVKAHRTEKEERATAPGEKLVTKGNEKADELATCGARALSIKHLRTYICASLEHAAPFHVQVWGGKTVMFLHQRKSVATCAKEQ